MPAHMCTAARELCPRDTAGSCPRRSPCSCQCCPRCTSAASRPTDILHRSACACAPLGCAVFDRPNEFLCCKACFDNRVMRHGISLKEPNPVGSRPCPWKIKDQILVTALRLPCGMKLSKETCVMARETGGEGWRKRERTRARVRERGSVINRISP